MQESLRIEPRKKQKFGAKQSLLSPLWPFSFKQVGDLSILDKIEYQHQLGSSDVLGH